MRTATRRHALRCLAAGAALATLAAMASDFPNKPVRIIVPYPAGSTPDALARNLGVRMQADLGVPVVIDNKPGASTFIGMQALLAAPADGYTIAMTSVSTAVVNPMVFSKMPYDPQTDFAPLAYLGGSPYALVVNSDLKVNSLAELVALAKAQGGKMNYASGGIGNTTHIVAEKFKVATATDITHVPYAGSAPAIKSLLAGETQLYFDSANNPVPLVKAGKLKALAVTSRDRMPVLPGVPTMVESGYKDFVMTAWYGISAPRKTPPEAVARLAQSINKALADKSFREQSEAVGLELPASSSPKHLEEVFASEREKWGPVVRSLNLRLD
jgi:tripartite-type tricarboxylate transporter receptor subunit TctC